MHQLPSFFPHHKLDEVREAGEDKQAREMQELGMAAWHRWLLL
jgi:hypothetical protein